MTKYKPLHPKDDMNRLYVSRKGEGRGLNSIEDCVDTSIRLLENDMKKSPVGWGCRIRRLHLCREVRPPNVSLGYDTKQSTGEVPEILELWGIRSTPSLPLLLGPLLPAMVAPDRTRTMDWIELTAYLCKSELLELELLTIPNSLK